METPGTLRVFLICVNRLVCEAVYVLLRREGITLLGMETDPLTALEQVRDLRPEVVMVEGNASEFTAELKVKLACLMYEMANLRVICFDLANHEIDVYSQQQRKLINTHDLVAAINAQA